MAARGADADAEARGMGIGRSAAGVAVEEAVDKLREVQTSMDLNLDDSRTSVASHL